MVHHGICARIRHPIYTSIMLAAVGWTLIWQSWLGLLAASILNQVITPYHQKLDRHEAVAQKAGRVFSSALYKALYKALYRPTELSLKFHRQKLLL